MPTVRISPSSSGEPAVACPEIFASAKWAFAHAAVTGPIHVSDFRFAGRVVRLSAARRALFESLRPSFRHLEVHLAQPRPELTMHVWDVHETGVPCPVSLADGQSAGASAVHLSPTARLIAHRGPSWFGWLDRPRREMVVCFEAAGRLTLADRAKPLQELLAVWHLDQRVPLVRAGVVASGGVGILIPGNGTNGAAAAALACAVAGYDYLGDGVVGLEPVAAGGLTAHSLYGSTTIDAEHLHQYPELVGHAIGGPLPEDGVRLVMLNRLLPRPIARTAEIHAVVVPRRRPGTRATLSPATRVDALNALAPAAALALPGWNAGHAGALAGAIASLPCYFLDMNERGGAVPACLRDLARLS